MPVVSLAVPPSFPDMNAFAGLKPYHLSVDLGLAARIPLVRRTDAGKFGGLNLPRYNSIGQREAHANDTDHQNRENRTPEHWDPH